MADDRQSAETPAPADGSPATGPKSRSGEGSVSRPAVPEQPTRGRPAPSTSRYDREVAARSQPSWVSRALSNGKTALTAVRSQVAAAIWMAAVLAAIALALGALLIALDANMDNVLVSSLLDLDRSIDGPFWKVFDFYKETKTGQQGRPDDVKNYLVNWGLAAAGYLVVGRLLDRLIRPATR